MKGIFSDRSVSFQLGILFTTFLIGYFIASILTIPLIRLGSGTIFPAKMLELPVSILLAVQFISAICTFLLPAVCTAWLCSKQPSSFLYLKSFRIDIRLLLLVTLSMFLISPTVSLTAYLNSLVRFPEWMAPFEEWIKTTEESAAELTNKMLSQKGILAFCMNLLVVAIATAITEEFLFRGTLFSILQRKITNHHLVIWIVAILFSAIHFQFYGFIPRMLLGAYLGYLVYWTKNIWIPVFAHFINNAVAIIGISNDSLKENTFFAETIPAKDLAWFSITAIVCLILFFICAGRIKKTNDSQSITNPTE